MSDKEPRRRKKRKDFQRKDDVHSEEQNFVPTRSESKDSDQEVEEEVPLHTHQPSGFAKFVFVILFSGLAVSMSFIFISLHGTERGSVDIFDDHHSEELVSLESYDQGENISLNADHDEDSENGSSTLEIHNDVEDWSPSEYLSGNIMDMLPDIGNILSFNKEGFKEHSLDDDLNSESAQRKETILERLSEETSDNSHQENEIEIDLDNIEIHSINDDESMDQTYSEIDAEPTSSSLSSESSPEILQSLQEKTEDEEESAPVLQVSHDYTTQTQESTYDDYEEESDFTPVHSEEHPSLYVSPTVMSEVSTEASSEEYASTDDGFSTTIADLYEDEIESNTELNSFTTPEYEEDDRLLYEKAAITNEADYEIREDLDQLDRILEKNLAEVDDDDEEEDDNDDNETEEEFDFWQF